MRIVDENEYARIEDDGYYYIVTDKTLEHLPIHHEGETRSLAHIKIEFVLVEDKLTPMRTYYPKDEVDIKAVYTVYNRLTKIHSKT